MIDDFEALLRDLWGNLLSGEAERVNAAWAGLDPGEQQAVLAHLHEMVEGEGWQAVQREAALAALKAIGTG
jgi:hypothetical protein